jgi:hypothetical protein
MLIIISIGPGFRFRNIASCVLSPNANIQMEPTDRQSKQTVSKEYDAIFLKSSLFLVLEYNRGTKGVPS